MYAKTNQHCQAEDCLASIWNDLPLVFIDKAILLFRKRLRFCVAAAGRHFEHSDKNTKRAADTHYWSVWSIYGKVVQSLIRYYERIAEYAACNCMFTWKSEPQSLNCCIYWTPCAIFIKFAEYVDWILSCYLCKFGEFQRYTIFPTGLLFWRALCTANIF